MEILFESIDMPGYYIQVVFLSFIGLILIAMSIGLTISMIKERKLKANDMTGVVVTFVMFVGIVLLLVFVLEPEITYKAIITDFNEVYEQGYKVIEQEGKLFTLEKVNND